MKQFTKFGDGIGGGFKIFGVILFVWAPFIFCVSGGLTMRTLIIGGAVVLAGFSFFLLDKWWEIRIDNAEKSLLDADEETQPESTRLE